MIKTAEHFTHYSRLRKEVLTFHKYFIDNITPNNCKVGCADCCEEIGIVPVEFYYLQEHLKMSGKTLNKTNNKCPFLDNNNICLIYHYRPLICITQGLAFIIKEDDPKNPQLIFCEKNQHLLTEYKDNFSFFDYETMLAKLITINILFCEENNIPFDRILIGNLI